jgi:uncharacterized membrane-anchored protein
VKHLTTLALSTAVAAQIVILSAMYVLAALPLWTGKEVALKVMPVDPRSMFRGNYARLRYEISAIDKKFFTETEGLRNGEVVYVMLEPDTDGLYRHSAVVLDKPLNGVFVRGRIQGGPLNQGSSYRIRYGIEAFFAPKEKAIALEEQLRTGSVALLMVSDDGRARIKDVTGS